MNIVPELDVRAVLIQGLHELAEDSFAIDELVKRVDALRQGSQLQWEADLRAELVRMLTPTDDRYVFVKVGYPTDAAHLPALSIILDNASEDTSGAMLGDSLGSSYRVEGVAPDRTVGAVFVQNEPLGAAGLTAASYKAAPAESTEDSTRQAPLPDPLGGEAFPLQEPARRTIEHELGGTDWSSTVEVGCWHLAPEGALLLQAAARWALFRGKGQLQSSGIFDVRFDEGGAQPDERLEPRVGYVPMVRVHLDWTYRQTRVRARRGNFEGGITLNNTFNC
jgi:hypothetical protein